VRAVSQPKNLVPEVRWDLNYFKLDSTNNLKYGCREGKILMALQAKTKSLKIEIRYINNSPPGLFVLLQSAVYILVLCV